MWHDVDNARPDVAVSSIEVGRDSRAKDAREGVVCIQVSPAGVNQCPGARIKIISLEVET